MAPPSTPDKYPPSSAFDTKIEIKVGSSERKSFFMHKGVLGFYSGYFAAAFAKDSWLESNAGVFDLETEEIKVFEKFQYWAYTRRLCDAEVEIVEAMDWRDIIDLWILGDRRDIPLLQNDAINLLRTKIVDFWTVPTAHLLHVYSNTTPGSKLRKFLIDVIGNTAEFDEGTTEFLRENYNKEALIDLIAVIWNPPAETWSLEDLDELNMCQYHVHEAGMECDDAA